MARSTLIALAVATLLLGGYLCVEGERAPVVERDRRLFSGLETGAVRRLRIARRGAPAIEVSRFGEHWYLEAPVKGRADDAAIGAILSSVEFLETLRWLEGGVSRKQRGLDPPLIRLQLLGSTGGTLADLRIGAADPSAQGRYVQIGDRVHVVSQELHRRVEREPDELRCREMLPWRAAQIQRVEIAGLPPAARRVTLEATGDGAWRVSDGQMTVRAAEERVNRVLAALASLRAQLFVRGAGARVQTTVQIAGGARGGGVRHAALRFAGGCPGRGDLRLVARREQGATGAAAGAWSWACVDAEEVALLEGIGESLRDRRITSVTEERLVELHIVRSGDSLLLRRRSGSWRIASKQAEGAAADTEVLRDWVAALHARGELRVPEPALLARLDPARTARVTVTLVSEGGPRETLRFGVARHGLVPVRRDAEDALLWVAQDALPTLTSDPLAFRSREVLALRPADIESVLTLRHGPAGGEEELLLRARRGWRIEHPVRVPADPELVARLLEALASLRASRLIGGRGSFRPALTLEISTKAASDLTKEEEQPSAGRRYRMEVGELRGESCPARLAGRGSFELPGTLCRLLSGRRGARALFPALDGQELSTAHFTYHRPGSPSVEVSLRRRGATWYEGASIADPQRVSSALRLLRELRGELLGYEMVQAGRQERVRIEISQEDVRRAVWIARGQSQQIRAAVDGLPAVHAIAAELWQRLSSWVGERVQPSQELHRGSGGATRRSR